VKAKRIIYLSILSISILSSFIYVELRQRNTKKYTPPEIERLVNIHPEGWEAIESKITNQDWKSAAIGEYDEIYGKSYRNKDGKTVSIIITWSRNGLQKAGHIQQLCYTTQGYKVISPYKKYVYIKEKKHELTEFTAQKIADVYEDVVYWRISDGKIMNNLTELGNNDYRLMHRILKTKEILTSIFREIPENIMVRVSHTRNYSEKVSLIPEEFTKKYLELLSEKDRIRLIGK
jgi:hypothetical protein